MIYLLDTNMVSYIVRGRSAAACDRLLSLAGDEIAAVSSITVAEVRFGLAKKPEATALRSLMESFLASIRVLPWGIHEAEAYGTLRAVLEKKGIPLGNMDMMIAAHALATGAVLVTNDRAFSQAEELALLENWAVDL